MTIGRGYQHLQQGVQSETMATEGWALGQLGLGPASMATGIEVCSDSSMLDKDVRLKL